MSFHHHGSRDNVSIHEPDRSCQFEAPHPETIRDARRRVMSALRNRQSTTFLRNRFFEHIHLWINWRAALVRLPLWTGIVPTLVSAIGASLISSTATAQNPAEPLVNEPGFATDPAISADGRWLAYASDHGGSRSLNLWLRPLLGGHSAALRSASHSRSAWASRGVTSG